MTIKKHPFSSGALVRGSRIPLSNNELKSPRHQTNDDNENEQNRTLFVAPSSELTSLPSLTSDQITDTYQSEPLPIQDASSQTTDMTSYKAIEAAYLEHGIRIRLSPSKPITTTVPTPGRRSAGSQRYTAFSNRNPSRTSSVLHYATTTQEIDHDTRSFSVLQQMSSNGFDPTQTLNVSFAQSSTQGVDEPINQEYLSPSIITTEYSNPVTPPDKPLLANHRQNPPVSFHNDPDLAYMSSLLKTSIGQSYRGESRESEKKKRNR